MNSATIVFQGDSITDCGRNREETAPNAGLGSGYVSLLASELLKRQPEVKTYNRGVSGNRVVDLCARWKSETLNLNPDILSILIGVNDTWHGFMYNSGIDLERFDRFYRLLMDWTVAILPECKNILCEPFILPCGVVTAAWAEEMRQRTDLVRAIAKDYHALLVPFQDEFDLAMKRSPAEFWAADGVHPTLAGHELMKQAWLKTAAPLL